MDILHETHEQNHFSRCLKIRYTVTCKRSYVNIYITRKRKEGKQKVELTYIIKGKASKGAYRTEYQEHEIDPH